MTPANTVSNHGERSELAFPCNQIDDCLNCKHRNFIQQLMEVDAEIQLTQASRDKSTRGRSNNKNKGVRTMTGIPTETVDMN